MTKPSCPSCADPSPRYLQDSSNFAVVDYYRCEACGCVFNVPKGRPEAAPKSVMGCVDELAPK
jgi:hypothetical protein